MKATELMVGDWVYCEGQPTPENVTIQTIAEDGVWFNGPNYEGAASFDRIFPIPLTPEILEKNGFKNIGDDCWQLEEHPYYFWIDFFAHQYGCEYALSFDHDEHRLKLYGIPDVHELQHALRLCGNDKEIKL